MKKEILLKGLYDIDINKGSVDLVLVELSYIALESNSFDLMKNFINEEQLNKITKDTIDIFGVCVLREFLKEVKNLTSPYFYYDDQHKTVRSVTRQDLLYLKRDLKKRLKKER